MKPYIRIALFVVLFIAIAGILAGIYMFNLKHTDMAKAKPQFVTTSILLQKEFEDNESAASAKYINKIIEVSGKIVSVDPVEKSNVNISLATSSDLSSVICTFPALSNPLKFKPGDEITVRGECSGFLMGVLLNNCAVIK